MRVRTSVKRVIGYLGLVALLCGAPLPARAQTETGAICVAAFEDANANSVRDPGEGPLAGVNVNLLTGDAVIIAAHVVQPGEAQYCFEDLLTGIYTVSFADEPTYDPTTAREGSFALDAGQRLTINDFGAVPVPLSDLRAELAAASDNSDEPMEPSTRLMISTAGAMIVMLFLIGVGAVVIGFNSWRRARRARPIPPPLEIRPPSR